MQQVANRALYLLPEDLIHAGFMFGLFFNPDDGSNILV
jgi:hypothetical protein